MQAGLSEAAGHTTREESFMKYQERDAVLMTLGKSFKFQDSALPRP